MRKIAKIDANQQEIVKMLRQLGCSVRSLAQVGNGVPDLLCGFRGKTFLFEVKDGKKPPSRRALTPEEKTFFDEWRGGFLQIVNNPEEAISAVLAS